MPRRVQHPCTRKGCPHTRPRQRFLCDVHWARLPGWLRAKLARVNNRADRDALRAQAHAELDAREAADAAAAEAARIHIQRLTGEHEYEEAAE
jgi:hypothetical protein